MTRQYERFSQMLNNLIEAAGLRKNEMIRNLEIDRSSYFQILKGSRLPTGEQYLALKRILRLPKEENSRLDDLYHRAALGEDIWDDILQVNDFIRLLSEMESASPAEGSSPEKTPAAEPADEVPSPCLRYLKSRGEVEAAIEEILTETSRQQELDFFTPASADAFYSRLKQLITRADGSLRIRQLMGLPGGRVTDRQEAVGIFQGLSIFLSARANVRLESRYYYNSVSKISDIGLLFPWYIRCGTSVLMISADFCSALFSREQALAKAYAGQFGKAFAEATPLLKNYGSLEQNLRAVREFLKGKQEVNYEAIPCTAMIATPHMIRKYVIPQAQEELIAHCETLQKSETMIDIASLSGLRRFLTSRKIPEIPASYMQPVETADLIWYVDNLLERLGTTLFLIDESRIPAAYDWDITIIEEFSVLIHHHNYDTMIVDEKNIVDIFTSFAMHIAETSLVLETEKARKELLDIRSELCRGMGK